MAQVPEPVQAQDLARAQLPGQAQVKALAQVRVQGLRAKVPVKARADVRAQALRAEAAALAALSNCSNLRKRFSN